MAEKKEYVKWFKDIGKKDVAFVGGKNASLGEMFSQLENKGINVPGGFVLTAAGYRYFLGENGIDSELKEVFKKFKPSNLQSLRETGKKARELIMKGDFPEDLEKELKDYYRKMSKDYGLSKATVAVRSSATAEDLPSASFAGQHETFLNIKGEKDLLGSVKKCMASLFTDRAISYREGKGFKHLQIALSVGIQKMIRSDSASSGVMFTIDTETGFSNVVSINSIWGVGEMIVKGKITPDQFYVFKPALKKGYKAIIVKNLGRKSRKYVFSAKSGLKEKTVVKKDQLRFSLPDEEILKLARWAVEIEKHYGRPQDIEWAKDGESKKLFIVQSRPETVHAPQKENLYKEYVLKDKGKKPALTGIAVGNKIGKGKVRVIPDISGSSQFKKGEVLVTRMTDPDWVPVMRIASAIVTDEGGKTAHAAIVSRELGLPCIVGAQTATKELKTGETVTVDCTQSLQGRVFKGNIPFAVKKYNLKNLPKPKVKIMINMAVPEAAFSSSFIPNAGVGLAREEFIITEKIKVHPLALYHYSKIKDKKLKKRIDELTIEHKDKKEFFIKELAEGIGQIASAFWPKPVIVRFSDFKTNEYRNLVGGEKFEPEEENPMLGFRGASRYYSESFKPAFEMECEAVKRVREIFGLKNLQVMIPFCRTVGEGMKVLSLMEKFGLKKGKDGLKVYVMCEVPSNVILSDEFLKIFDGMSIGSNDLTQLSLGIDRDNANIAAIGDERDPTVKKMIKKVVNMCKRKNKYCGICGEAPSYFPEFAGFLVGEGIKSISLNSDAVIKTIMALDNKKKKAKKRNV